MQNLTCNQNRQWTEIWIPCCHFEWQGRLQLKPSQACYINDACTQAYSLWWALDPVESLCILGRNVKLLLVLVRLITPWCMKSENVSIHTYYFHWSLLSNQMLIVIIKKIFLKFCAGVKGAHKLLFTLHTCRPWSFFATQNGGIVSSFPSTTCFTFSSVRYLCQLHNVC